MKFRTSKKAVMNGYTHIIKVPYCNLQNMLNWENPVAYTCGGDGWHADVYEVGQGIAICTGYQPFGNVIPKYDTMKEFDNRAEEIRNEYNRSHITDMERKHMIAALIRDFVGTAITESEGGIRK